MPIVTTIEGRIAQVAIDRPEKRNTLSSELCKDLAREFLELNDDTRVRSIVLCGHNNVFCAGLDIEEQLAENTPIFNEFQKVIDALDALSKPVVAPEFGRFRQIKSSQLFDYQRVQSFFNLLSCVHARACP